MIARIVIPIILVALLTDWYVDRRFICMCRPHRKALRCCWWLQTTLVVVYSVSLALSKNFAPDNLDLLSWYLLLLTVWILPKLVFVVCSALGWGHCVYHKTKTNWGNPIGLLCGFILACMSIYAYTLGFSKLEIRHVTYYSKDLPQVFDGYRIVQFSDAHVGTYGETRAGVLNAAIDSMNAQKADMIVFTGDLQNMRPMELLPHQKALGSLKAKDGVYSIMGNHDYAYYIEADENTRKANLQRMMDLQKQMGWQLLMNENRVVRRGTDSIVVAGMEYEGKSVKVPNKGDIKKTLHGIDANHAFVVMLQHDPTSWRTDILPHSRAQLTLSGHTHAGQVEIFGWSPISLLYKEWGGMYYEGKRAINVSTGLGGFVPFRIGCPGEIVLIELRKDK